MSKSNTNLPQLSTSILEAANEIGNGEISTYMGDVLQPKTVIEEVSKISVAFPTLSPQFIDILIQRAIEKGFTSKRLRDSVNHVIDNCQYPNPTLANFLSFDKRIKVLTYNELSELVCSHRAEFGDYHRYSINNKALYIRKVDKELYGMPDQL
jgi:hypothetical protein